MRTNRIIIYVTLLCVIVLLSGCSSGIADNPSEIMLQALSQIMDKESYQYEKSKQKEISGVTLNELQPENEEEDDHPARIAEQLLASVQDVQLDLTADPGTFKLTMKLDGESFHQELISKFEQQRSKLSEAKTKLNFEGEQVTHSQQVFAKSEQFVDEMLDTLTVETEAEMIVNQSNQFPARLQLIRKLDYKRGGKNKQETVTIHYEFFPYTK